MSIRKIIYWILIIVFSIYILLWIFSIKKYPVKFGASFDYDYAQYLGLDWKKTYLGILNELKPEFIRVSLKWNEIEKEKDVYNWEKSDYMLNEAIKRNTKVTLVVGQKTPRWPECNEPTWTNSLSKEERKKEFLEYFEKGVTRYKDNKALEIWQVENEPYILFPFGECNHYDKEIIEAELETIKKLDGVQRTLITDSGELSIWLPASQKADLFGTTLYQRVRTPSGRMFSYSWLPPAYYKIRAKILGVKYDNFFVSELQAEPWLLLNDPKIATIEEINKTLSLQILNKNISYAKKVGASRIYLWGAEWWYFMKEKKQNSSYWNFAKEIFQK